MSRPSRQTTAGRIYLDLRALARQQGRPTDEILVLFVLERFLYRLSRSVHRERLVLKGGMLLAVFEERRPTRDVDLLARATDNDIDTVATLIRDVLAVKVDDGVVFDAARLTARIIRQGEVYAGVRIAVPARVDRTRHSLRVDVNVGDPVIPRSSRSRWKWTFRPCYSRLPNARMSATSVHPAGNTGIVPSRSAIP